MEIKGENYQISYDSDSSTIHCQGTLRLYGKLGYAEIVTLLDNVMEEKPESITLDLSDLKFLNSSGINAISRFVIKVRNQNHSRLVIKGADAYPWQRKSLKNLKRLMPDLTLEYV